MILVSGDLRVKKESANKLVKALREAHADNAGFSIRRDNDEIVAFADLQPGADHAVYTVCIGGQVVRKIPRREVVGTVRLYADVQRLRGKLKGAPAMVVSPEAA